MQTAMAMEDAGDYAGAAKQYQALADAGDKAAEFNLARMHLTSGHVVAAGILFGRIVEREPDNIPAMHALAMARLDGGRTYEAVELLRRIVELLPTPEHWRDLCFYSLHLEWDYDALHREAAKYLPTAPAPQSTWDGVRPIRVGYICPDAPTVYPFFLPVLAAHSKAVEVFCYRDGKTPSEIGSWTTSCIVSHLQDDDLAKLIRDDQIDVLVNLKERRLGTMALRPAPLMYSWIGYPSWLGVQGVEVIVDQWAYHPDGIDMVPPPCETNGYVTFGSLNRPCKITDEVAATWGAIMREVPTARLKVLAVGGELNTDVRDLLVRGGVPGDRLTLTPTTDRAGFLRLINSIDIALDTWPYNGTATTCDALWQGVPVITLAGESIRQRAGKSILDTLGLLTACQTPGEYIAKACAWSADSLSWMSGARSVLHADMASLCDGGRVARALEAKWAEALKKL